MQTHGSSHSPQGGFFNTLAQTGTTFYNTAIIVKGKGSILRDTKTLKKKAKRKVVSQKMALGLVDVVKQNGLSELTKSYWNTYHCLNQLSVVDGRVHGKYCKNRFCTVCCANRKADIINSYLPVMQTWGNPYFVTLTVKAVPFFRLNPVMKSMLKEFSAIVETYRKRFQRGKDIKLVGIRSLECNYNPKRKSYNPHFHCIVANKEMADILISEWLKRSNKNWTGKKGQDARRVFNDVSALIEVVKYGSKIFTEPDVEKKSKNKDGRTMYVAALNNIFTAMKGLRIFERFGFNLPKVDSSTTVADKIAEEYTEWIFHPASYDWLHIETGNPLTNFLPTMELLDLLENKIDVEQE